MDTQRKKPLTYIIGASLSVALGISSSFISFYYTVQKPTSSMDLSIETFIKSASENELTQKKFEENRKFIIQANAIANSIKSDLNDPQVINSLKLSEINDRVDSLNNKITNLYKAIDSSPEKSLSIPSINKDIHSLDEKIKYISDNFEHQIDRAYQILMWVCGTLVIGMITLIITIWLSMRSKP